MEESAETISIENAKQDKSAFSQLFQQYYTFLYRYLFKLTMNKEMTEDLLQETMIRAYMNLPKFRYQSKFSTWLISIATRLYLDEQRKSKRDRKRQQQLTENEKRKMKWELEQGNMHWSLHLDLFASLSIETRTLILLRHYYGFSLEEISAMTKLRTGTVKSRIHYALKKLREEWSDETR
ncbi:RNA polymerase sigma factor SigY [Terribacillus saccharophilus]|uniref:RNA polymerase sigma factor SigY n=1 Tax=Terribacillus saccharophilus TaxID=361277 RepID=UPI000BA548F2|nr:RNA polymerase sigma factor SigY [Terribacillus saccharophilus]PAF35169.1 RNA polymerase sigma factor SigY [Terribacillus saccharophilus]